MDLEIAKFLNELGAGSIIDALTQAISNTTFLTILWIIIATTILVFDKKNGKKILIALLIAFVLHFLISELFFKDFFELLRLRPFIAHPDTINTIGNQIYIDSSFPSSHMSSTTAILTVLIYFYRKVMIPAIIFILVMAFARIHNGMHYPTDVLAGTVFGIIFGIVGIFTSKKIISK